MTTVSTLSMTQLKSIFQSYKEIEELDCQIYYDTTDDYHSIWKFETGFTLSVYYHYCSPIAIAIGENIINHTNESHIEGLCEDGELDEDDIDDYEFPMTEETIDGVLYTTNNLTYIVRYNPDLDDECDTLALLLENHYENQ